jgi:2,3-bisphosphoglycerate-independent phosphoglycerate mutase
LFNGPKNKSLSDGGRLSDIAPTILELMDLTPPPEMTGNSLLL